MHARDFCFWMQSLFEVAKITEFDAEQTALIRQHLGLVFQHDPSITGVEHAAANSQKPIPKLRDVLEDMSHGAQGRSNGQILLC